MYNLMIKDLIIQKKQLYLFIPFIVFFAFFGKHMSPSFIFLMASLYIPLNGYIYEEQVDANVLLNSLPYTRKEIVVAKYMGAIIYMVMAVAVTSLILYVARFPFTWQDIALAVGMFFIFSAVAFPLFYILKPGYIGAVMIIGLIVLASMGPIVFRFLSQYLPAISNFITQTPQPILYGLGAIISVILYVISWLTSHTVYQRKVF